jgi:acyl-CoA thioesterase-2
VDFAEMMQLEPHGTDVYVGVGPRYPWGGLYGGQIVAQGLRAAAATVEDRFRVHSLHAYFIRRGDQDEPIRFEVDRTRNGRSFVTRQVVARQSVGAILTMSLSFQVDEAGHDVQIARLPDIPPPEELTGESWSTMFDRRFAGPRNEEQGRGIAWMRLLDTIGDDPVLQACALAYLSDDVPTDAVVAVHPERPAPGAGDAFEYGFMSASLDHAIWFHRPVRFDRWHLHTQETLALSGHRALVRGAIQDADGHAVASVMQEVLVRPTVERS